MNNKGSDQDELALPICLPLSLTHLARETWELPEGQSTGLGPQAEGTGFVNGADKRGGGKGRLRPIGWELQPLSQDTPNPLI